MLYESRSVRRLKQKQDAKQRNILIGALLCVTLIVVALWVWTPPGMLTGLMQAFWNLLGVTPPNSDAVDTIGSIVYSSEEASSIAEVLGSLGATLPEVSTEQKLPTDEQQIAWEVDVPWSAAVGDDYFSDALFIGDSISHGLDHYRIIPNATFVCSTGINLSTIWTSTDFFAAPYQLSDGTPAGTPITMMQAIGLQPVPQKIYIMMGSNGIAWLSLSSMVSDYSALVDQLQAWFPESLIYLQGIPPATAAKGFEYPGFAISSIKNYNDSLRNLALEKKVKYLDIYTALANDAGYLPDEVASAGDGVHFSPSHYMVWYEYLKTHTVVESDS